MWSPRQDPEGASKEHESAGVRAGRRDGWGGARVLLLQDRQPTGFCCFEGDGSHLCGDGDALWEGDAAQTVTRVLQD